MFMIHNGKTCVYFEKGKFDDYCVYINDNNHFKYAPKDDEYFQWILDLANKYGTSLVWTDFSKLYDIVDENLNEEKAMLLIKEIDSHYNEDTFLWWIIFYMTMVAECKKEFAILKKRIKRLGVYNVLFDECDINDVTSYMKNKSWRYLDKIMRERGI